jgi:hypothetical protein
MPSINGDVRIGGGARKNLAIDGLPQHPPIQIPRRPAAGCRVMAGIDEIWSRLERLHPTAPTFQGRQERQRHRRLADVAGGTGDDETGKLHIRRISIST